VALWNFGQANVTLCPMSEDTPSDKAPPQAANTTLLSTHRKAKSKATARGKTLCGRGFHKWTINKKNQFDTKTGKLVSSYACARCGEKRTKLT